jgi:hypothetical protein
MRNPITPESPETSAAAPTLTGGSGRRSFLAGALCLLFAISGCVTVPVSVGNPIPGMTTIAVAPFFNLSAEPTVDGRRFALAYYAELQKTANYQVLPVGVVETAIRENELDMGSPADVVKLAHILDVDAVVIGAVTEYVPYYPPQLAMHIQWYSAHDWTFLQPGPAAPNSDPYPGQPCPPGGADFAPGDPARTPVAVRAQSPSAGSGEPRTIWSPPPAAKAATPGQIAQSASGKEKEQGGPVVWPPRIDPSDSIPRPALQPPPEVLDGKHAVRPQPRAPQPLMSYTRFFDGGDDDVAEMLKAFYHIRRDMRSGNWEAYLHRSDDFLRFTAHVMIVEMLSMHGAPLVTDYYLRYWN